MPFLNPCGGARWQTLPDWTIEVEGQGVVTYDPGTVPFQQMEKCWDNWKGLILDNAGTFSLPPSWILAVMCQETGLWSADPEKQATIVAPDGGVGLMQITDKSLGNPQDMLDPATNVAIGSALLAKLAARHDDELPEVVANYNAGSVRCGGTNQWNMVMTGDYAGHVIRWNNTAILHLDMRRPRVLLGLALAAAGVYTGALIAGIAKMPKLIGRYV